MAQYQDRATTKTRSWMLHVLHVAACMSLHVAAVVAKRRAALLHATAGAHGEKRWVSLMVSL